MSLVETTYWAAATLGFLGAFNNDYINKTTLNHWISACQNADGGFSLFLGFHSDTVSTYYGLELFKLLYQEPMSKIAAIEFLKGAQYTDGSFAISPTITMYGDDAITTFIVTYLASKSLYDYNYQPEEINALVEWYLACISNTTGGVGDLPSFGADLRNTPYGLILLDEVKIDQSFDPTNLNEMLLTIIIVEAGIIFLFAFIKLISIINVSISKRIKARFGIGEKLNVTYLQKFPSIYCEDLSIYGGRKLIIDSMSIRIEHGEILGVLGESGAGKSTFVKALLGMRKFTGISRIYGMDSKKESNKFRPIYGYVPQDLSKVYLNFTTLENMLYFGQQYGLTEKEIEYVWKEYTTIILNKIKSGK